MVLAIKAAPAFRAGSRPPRRRRRSTMAACARRCTPIRTSCSAPCAPDRVPRRPSPTRRLQRRRSCYCAMRRATQTVDLGRRAIREIVHLLMCRHGGALDASVVAGSGRIAHAAPGRVGRIRAAGVVVARTTRDWIHRKSFPVEVCVILVGRRYLRAAARSSPCCWSALQRSARTIGHQTMAFHRTASDFIVGSSSAMVPRKACLAAWRAPAEERVRLRLAPTRKSDSRRQPARDG